MNLFFRSGLFLLFTLTFFSAHAQDTLPKFSLVDKGNNRIIISWTNPYKNSIHQLSIQRSTDSTKNFKSILTLPDPTVPQNGFADTKAPAPHMFYRLYILLDSGKYVFSKAKRPLLDTVRGRETPAVNVPQVQNDPPPVTPRTTEPTHTREPDKKELTKQEPVKPKEIPERIIVISRRDTVIGQVGEKSLRRFRDSVATRTKDTLSFRTADTIVIRPFVPKEIYKPSKFVFTEKDGNVKILLPDAADKKYSLRFFDENNVQVLEIKQIKTSPLTIDRSNFVHAGWFRFELYEDVTLKEKHKLFIPKDY